MRVSDAIEHRWSAVFEVFEAPEGFGYGLVAAGWYACRRSGSQPLGPFISREAAEAMMGEPDVCAPEL